MCVIYDDGFNYLTKMCLTNMREAAFVLAEESKAGATVIISSWTPPTTINISTITLILLFGAKKKPCWNLFALIEKVIHGPPTGNRLH
jgi:hypothetical protein